MDRTPGFDYGEGYHETVAEPELTVAGQAAPEGGGPRLRLTTDLNIGFEGPTATAAICSAVH